MIEPGTSAWPPAPIPIERLVLRESDAGDRAAFVELLAPPEVWGRGYAFEECGAGQWSGVRPSATQAGRGVAR